MYFINFTNSASKLLIHTDEQNVQKVFVNSEQRLRETKVTFAEPPHSHVSTVNKENHEISTQYAEKVLLGYQK